MNYLYICMFLMFLTTYLIRVIPIGFVFRISSTTSRSACCPQ